MKLSAFRAGSSACLLQRECRRFLLCLCLAVLFLTACSRKPTPSASSAVTIQHEISPNPATVGPIVVTLRLTDSASKAVAGAHIALEADMSHAGMAPVFGDAKEVAPGRYQSQLALGMAGDWVILLHVVLPGGEKLERQIDLRGVEPAAQSRATPFARPNQASC